MKKRIIKFWNKIFKKKNKIKTIKCNKNRHNNNTTNMVTMMNTDKSCHKVWGPMKDVFRQKLILNAKWKIL